MMNPEPQKEHRWLEGLVGEWTYESKPYAVAGQEPTKFTGSESVRSLGGLWVVGEGQSEMPGGGPAQTVITLGFDPDRKRFVGTWVGEIPGHHQRKGCRSPHPDFARPGRGRQVDRVHDRALSAPEMNPRTTVYQAIAD